MIRTEFVLSCLLLGAFLCNDVSAVGQISNVCKTDADCGQGLNCFQCAAANATAPPICTRSLATPVSSFVKNTTLPFNQYAWVTTHNSYAIEGVDPGLSSFNLAPRNQEDSVTSQLNNGVRGLMLDMYDFMNDIWLCHSYQGECYNFTAISPVNGTLTAIATFLAANPTEVVSIFIEDYVHATNGLTNAFTKAGLIKYMFPLAKMPPDGGNWPTLDSMIASNERLLVFSSIESKQATEGIAYQWNFVVENQYGSLLQNCPNRGESQPMNSLSRSLVLENYFPSGPNESFACVDNSADLLNVLGVCHTAAGNRWSNFVAVDFYMRCTGGGVFEAVDELNGELECGCTDIHYCKAGNARGVCVQSAPAPVGPRSPVPVTSAPPTPGAASSPESNAAASLYSSTSFMSLILSLAILLIRH